MPEISAVDSMVFARNGLWWLLSNTDFAGTGDNCNELSIFYTNNLTDGAWHAHAQNPIHIDSRFGRNGGLLRDGDRIFRLAQFQGLEAYGQAFSNVKSIKFHLTHIC